jgi:pSer/pThr/pTyr-binding forkhead associated (FHA) protein
MAGIPNPFPLPGDYPDDSAIGTRRETGHEIPQAEEPAKPPAAREEPAEVGEADPYRPTQRPPMAVLCILDDGSDDGEWLRLRADRIVIGRVDGDIVIPHDHLISSRHAELCRVESKGQLVWQLRDLSSTNGTYVRISTAIVESGQQILLGGRYYRFDDPLAAAAGRDGDDAPGTRRAIGGPNNPVLVPSLVHLTEKGDGERFFLGGVDNWIGRDGRQCAVVLADDRMVSPCHARLYRTDDGRWTIADARSRNGTWFRVLKVKLKRTSYFQLGEQRFMLRIT